MNLVPCGPKLSLVMPTGLNYEEIWGKIYTQVTNSVEDSEIAGSEHTTSEPSSMHKGEESARDSAHQLC
jgi:hypothetical protein